MRQYTTMKAGGIIYICVKDVDADKWDWETDPEIPPFTNQDRAAQVVRALNEMEQNDQDKNAASRR